MKKVLFYAVVAALIFYWWYEPPAKWKGMPAAAQPVQTTTNLPKPFYHGEFRITPLANYSVTGVVLSRQRYRNDESARICPLDLALGWGPMSTAYAINELSISQGGRFYEYSWRNESPLEPEQIAKNSANTHCIPANDAVKKILFSVQRHEVIAMEGYLVEVTFPEGGPWRSSLTRDDTQGGACEIMWVTSAERRRIKQ
jgi:hypothetical protein